MAAALKDGADVEAVETRPVPFMTTGEGCERPSARVAVVT